MSAKIYSDVFIKDVKATRWSSWVPFLPTYTPEADDKILGVDMVTAEADDEIPGVDMVQEQDVDVNLNFAPANEGSTK
jgi:hypothetical protein